MHENYRSLTRNRLLGLRWYEREKGFIKFDLLLLQWQRNQERCFISQIGEMQYVQRSRVDGLVTLWQLLWKRFIKSYPEN